MGPLDAFINASLPWIVRLAGLFWLIGATEIESDDLSPASVRSTLELLDDHGVAESLDLAAQIVVRLLLESVPLVGIEHIGDLPARLLDGGQAQAPVIGKL